VKPCTGYLEYPLKKCSDGDHHSGLRLFIHYTGKVQQATFCLLVLERIFQVASTGEDEPKWGGGRSYVYPLDSMGEGAHRTAPCVAQRTMCMSHLLGEPRIGSLRYPFGQVLLHELSVLPPLPAEQTVRPLWHASYP
jgi:hypothetical protein